MKPKPKKPTLDDAIIDRKLQREFEAATRWMDHLTKSPRYGGVLDVFAANPYCAALRRSGSLFLTIREIPVRLG